MADEYGDALPMSDDDLFALPADVHESLEILEQQWLLTPEQTALEILEARYDWHKEGFSPADAAAKFERAIQTAFEVQSTLKASNDSELFRADKVLRAVLDSYSNLTSLCSWSGIDSLPMLPVDAILRYQDDDTVKETAIQKVYQFILTWTRTWKLRHKGEIVYREIENTHAWVPATDFNNGDADIDTLEKLVNYICTRYRNQSIWLNWITISSKQIYDKLAGCIELDFPQLKTTRAWLAFRDGLYSVYTDTFIFYDDPNIKLLPTLAVCAYHNINFNQTYIPRPLGQPIPQGIPLHPMHEVSTPLFDGIMNTQDLCGHTRFWLYAMIGRCLYWDGVLDTWQVLPYLKGRAGTGKSTIVQTTEGIYNYQDVATLNNNTEPIFGLEPLTKNPLVWLAPEVKADFSLDQAQFQSAVSHEVMGIPRKNKTPWNGRVLAQGMMAGNTLPEKFEDKAGSIMRRLIVFYFGIEVLEKMTDLLQILKTQELPGIIRKANYCYRHAVVLVGSKDLWKSGLLSSHIIEENRKLYASSNLLRGFLNTAPLDIRPPDSADDTEFTWCPEQRFLTLFNEDCSRQSKRSGQWNTDFYSAVFMDAKINVRKAEYTWGDDGLTTGNVIVGVCPIEDRDKMRVIEGTRNPRFVDSLIKRTDRYKVTVEDYV